MVGTDFDPDEAARNVLSAGVGVTIRRGLKMAISGERTVRKSPLDQDGNFTRTRLLTTVTIGS